MGDSDSMERVGPLNFMADINPSDAAILTETQKAQLAITAAFAKAIEALPGASDWGKGLVDMLEQIAAVAAKAVDSVPAWVRKAFKENEGGDTEKN